MNAEQKPQETQPVSDLDPDSMAAIRDLMESEAARKPEPAPKLRLRKKTSPAPAPAREPAPKEPRVVAEQTAPAPQPKVNHPSRLALTLKERTDPLKAKILAYRPTPKHIIVAAAVLLVLFRPWVVVALILLTAFIVTATFLILGYDGFWRRAMGLGRWYAKRHPSRSVELHRKLDNFAMKFDAFLDRFPEGSVDGLYLPDLGDLAEADKRHGEALDRRFDTLRET